MAINALKTIKIGSRLVRKFANGNTAVLEKINGKRVLKMFDSTGKQIGHDSIAFVKKETVGNKTVLTKIRQLTDNSIAENSRVYDAEGKFLGSRKSEFDYKNHLRKKTIHLPDNQKISTVMGINNNGSNVRYARQINGEYINYNNRGLPIPRADIGEGKWNMSLLEMREAQQSKFPYERYLPEGCGLTALDETVPGRLF